MALVISMDIRCTPVYALVECYQQVNPLDSLPMSPPYSPVPNQVTNLVHNPLGNPLLVPQVTPLLSQVIHLGNQAPSPVCYQVQSPLPNLLFNQVLHLAPYQAHRRHHNPRLNHRLVLLNCQLLSPRHNRHPFRQLPHLMFQRVCHPVLLRQNRQLFPLLTLPLFFSGNL